MFPWIALNITVASMCVNQELANKTEKYFGGIYLKWLV
jgi:hypothetical protein